MDRQAQRDIRRKLKCPQFAQVPPYGSSSTAATDQPADAHLLAVEVAAVPAPITIRSKEFMSPTPIV